MNRFTTLRLFVLMTLRGREVPISDFVCEYGMEEELKYIIRNLEGRIEEREYEYDVSHSEWKKHVSITPIFDPSQQYWDDEWEAGYAFEEIYDGPPELEQKMDRAKRRHDRLYCAVGTLKLVLNPADAWEGIPF